MIKFNEKTGKHDVFLSYKKDGKYIRYSRSGLSKENAMIIEANALMMIKKKDFANLASLKVKNKVQKTITWFALHDLTETHKWKFNKTGKQSEQAARLIDKYLDGKRTITASPALITELVNQLQSDKRQAGVINTYLSALRTMLKLAHEHGYIDKMPKIPHFKVPVGRTEYLTDTELSVAKYWFDKNASLRFNLMFHLLAETGARPVELANIKWSDVVGSTVTLSETKGDNNRTLPIPESLNELVELFRASNEHSGTMSYDYLFNQKDKDTNQFRREWARMLADCNDVRPCTPYILRHTAATKLAKANVSIVLIQKWLGHKSVNTTLKYIHLNDHDLKDLAKFLEL